MPTQRDIEVYRIAISKADLASLSSEERGLAILAGHTLNVLGVWIRLAKMSSNVTPKHEVESRLSAGQSHILLRSLYGALVEAWEWIRKNRPVITNVYLPGMSDMGVAAYRELNRRFGRSGLLHTIRNEFSYHYPDAAQMCSAFASVPEDEDWSWYVSKDLANSFWMLSELVVGYGTMTTTGKADPAVGFKVIMDETFAVADLLQDFLMSVLQSLLDRNFSDRLRPPLVQTVTDAPSALEFWIPFYTDTGQDKEAAATIGNGVA
jgi:hypothetical protein